MRRHRIIHTAVPAAVVTAFTLFSVPVLAQQRDRGHASSQGQAVERAQPRGSESTPHVQSAPQPPRYVAPHVDARPATPAPRYDARPVTPAPHYDVRPVTPAPRYDARPVTPAPHYDVRPVTPAPRFDARPATPAPRYETPRVDPRSESHAIPRPEPRVGPRYESRGYFGPYREPRYGYRPYAFRPRFHFGFDFYIGYPVPYAWSYPYPVPVYGYAAPAGPVVVGPGSAVYGGVSLEINPPDAAVYVDGSYAGPVGDFDGTEQPLTLVAGRHHIEISAPGYQPMVFDVDVVAGQDIPYQGDLQPF